MNHIEQDRAAARFFAPGEGTIVVAVALIKNCAADRSDELAEDSGLDDLDRLVENWAMAAMVSHQQPRVGAFGGLNEPRAIFKGVGDRLFNQHRNICCDALQALLDVHLVGRREHYPVRSITDEKFRQRLVHRRIFPLSDFDRLWRGSMIADRTAPWLL